MFNLQSGHKLHLVMLHGHDLKNKHARVMVLLHDTSSECALQLSEVSLNTCNGYQVIDPTQKSTKMIKGK